MIKFVLSLLIFIQLPSLIDSRSEFELIEVISSYDNNGVVFYNLIEADTDEILIGSSIGVLKWTAESPSLIDKSVLGYARIQSKKRNGLYFDKALIDEIVTTKKFNIYYP